MPTRLTVSLARVVLCLCVTATFASGQPPAADAKARATAFFQALASGKADAFETMAQEQFAPEMLARRTPADRKNMVAQITNDFGALTLQQTTVVDDETVNMVIRGAKGLEGAVEVKLQPAAPRKILSVAIQVDAGGGGGERGRPAPVGPPVTSTMTSAEMSAVLDRYVADLAAKGTFSGVVLVARDGKSQFEKAYGQANRERAAANTVDTRFNIGSINKAFTRVAIGQLMAAGKIALSDTIGKLLPDYPNEKARQATVEQLMTHQAGVADFFGPAFDAAPKTQFRSNADYYRFVAPQPLLFEPGTKRQYCNGCYIVLGAIVERVSGLKYEDYIAQRVFTPAGMTGAGFFASDRLPEKVAIGYTRQTASGGEGPVRPNTDMHGIAGSGAGGAYASAADLLAFHSALRAGRLLDAKTTAWFFEEPAEAGRPVRGEIGIAGGAPGVSAVLESDGTWTVAVVGNLDPPAAEQLGAAIRRQLTRR